MIQGLFSHFAACAQHTFFGIPPWYKYLKVIEQQTPSGQQVCRVQADLYVNDKLNLESLLLIGFGILDILMRVAALVAVGFIIYAGVQYITSQGEPDKAKRALGTIINALVGLGITIVAAATVSFIGHRIGG